MSRYLYVVNLSGVVSRPLSGGVNPWRRDFSRAVALAIRRALKDEGLCGASGGCGQTLWTSGKGVS